MNCPICNATADVAYSGLYDDRFGYPGTFTLLNCTACGHLFLDGEFTPQRLHDMYSNYYPRTQFKLENFRPYQETGGLGAWLDGSKAGAYRWVPRNVRVLDIGCGFGESLAYHKARGCDVYGVEIDENILRVADKYDFKVHVGLFDPSIYEENFFDYVTMHQVIEHVTDPVNTLKGIMRVLKPGGIAILSAPNKSGWGTKVFGRRWINWHEPYHLQFFSIRSMQLAAEQAGLIFDKSLTVTLATWLHYQWMHLISYPAEGQPSVFWMPGGKWSTRQRFGLKIIRSIAMSRFNHVITRIFDALGLGDNRIYFLRKPSIPE